jgi:hypothetical protein
MLPHEDMCLAELYFFGLVEVSGGLEYNEKRLIVALDLRPLVGIYGVLNSQFVQPELLGDGGELLLGGLIKSNPSHRAL